MSSGSIFSSSSATAATPTLLPSDHPEIAAVLPLSLSTFFSSYFNNRMVRLNRTDTGFDPATMWSRSDLLSTFEEMALDGRDARDVSWDAVPAQARRRFRVLIIGAGMSGLLAAIRLEEAGIPYLVVATKVDKLKRRETDRHLARIAREFQLRKGEIIGFSAIDGTGLDLLWQAIERATT